MSKEIENDMIEIDDDDMESVAGGIGSYDNIFYNNGDTIEIDLTRPSLSIGDGGADISQTIQISSGVKR